MPSVPSDRSPRGRAGDELVPKPRPKTAYKASSAAGPAGPAAAAAAAGGAASLQNASLATPKHPATEGRKDIVFATHSQQQNTT